MNPKIEYPNRNCTLCNDKDIQDEYHNYGTKMCLFSNSEDEIYY